MKIYINLSNLNMEVMYLCFFVLMILFILVLNFVHLLIFLLLMEFVVLFLMMIIYYVYMIEFINWIMIYFLILSVCEGVMGLSLIVLMIRFSGGDLLNSMNLMFS